MEQLTLCNTDPTSKDTVTNELKDIDGDGLNNSEELELGINPLYFDSDIGGNSPIEYDWWFAIGNASASMSTKCKRTGDTYTADITYNIEHTMIWKKR